MTSRSLRLFLCLLVVTLLMPSMPFGIVGPITAKASNEAQPTNTTLSSTIQPRDTQLTLASGTGVTAASGSIIGTYLIIDDEVLGIQQPAPSGQTTTWTVTRGLRGTLASVHAANAITLVLSNTQFYDNFIRGACTASQVPFWPRIVARAGLNGSKSILWEQCSGGLWREAMPLGDATSLGGTSSSAGPTKVCSIPVGSVAYGSLGSSTAGGGTGTTYYTTIYVPFTQKWTGLQALEGATAGGTDKFIYALWDSDGNTLATSALAGTATNSVNGFQQMAFTTPQLIPGPARYWVGVQTNGMTDTLRLVAASTFIDIFGNSAAQTFGTISAITPATSLTATTAPIMCLYN